MSSARKPAVIPLFDQNTGLPSSRPRFAPPSHVAAVQGGRQPAASALHP